MKKQKKYSFRQFICFVLAMLVLNVSVDPIDGDFILDGVVQITEDLSINEMESIAEWVLEEGLNIENAIPEQDETDNEDTFQKALDFVFQNLYEFNFTFQSAESLSAAFRYQVGESSHYPEIHSPPPQA
ncbi:MAG: hypothetical protein H7Y04_01880 [Verrucomicrobia bacterium]|nr:hypothetical protein [Cytophagales bacterium]